MMTQTRGATKLINMGHELTGLFHHVNASLILLLALVSLQVVAQQSTSTSLGDKHPITSPAPKQNSNEEATRIGTNQRPPLPNPSKQPLKASPTRDNTQEQPNGFRISSLNKQARRLEELDDRGDRLRDGVVQVRRVARNVHRKMNQMSKRVDQIQSMIDQDHDEQNEARPLGNQSSSEQSQQAGPTDNNRLWSAPLDEIISDTGDQPGSLAQNLTGLPSSELQRWSSSPPVIRSVIPDRQQQQQQTATNSEESPPDSADSLAQADYSSSVSGQQSNTIELPPANQGSNEPGHRQQNQSAIDDQTGMPSMLGPEWTPNQNYHYFSELNAKNHGGGGGGVSIGPAADETNRPSIASGGGGGKFQNMTILNSETDLVNSYSAVGPTTMSLMLSAQGQSANSSTQAPNSTTTTRRPGSVKGGSQQETDQKQRPKQSSVYTYSAGNYGRSSKGSSHSTTSTGRPINTAPAFGDEHNWPHQHYQQQENLSYSDGNINSSASPSADRIKWPTLATPAPSIDKYSAGDQLPTDQIGLPPSESDLPTANRYSSVMMPPNQSVGHHHQRAHHQPTHRSHRTSQNDEDHQQKQQRQQNPDRDHHQMSNAQAQQAGAGQPEEAPMQQQLSNNEPTESTAISANKYSMVTPSEPAQMPVSFSTEADRSLEARRQLVTTTDTTIYERKHQHQPPPSFASGEYKQQRPDTYSSRVDNQASDPSMLVSNASSMIHSQQGDHHNHVNHHHSLEANHNPHNLKHRSSTNPMMLDDQLASNYQPNDNQLASMLNYQQQQQQQQQQQNHQLHDTNQAQAQSSQDASVGSLYQTPQLALDAQHQSFRPAIQQQQFDQRSYYSTVPQQQQVVGDQQEASAATSGPDMGQADGGMSTQQLMSQLDQLSEQQQQQQQITRPYYGTSSLGQYYSTPTSIQDALQAASTNQNEQQGLLRQQRANQMDSSMADYNAQVLRYQQRALASQLANQQQVQRNSVDQQQQQQQQQQLQQSNRPIARAYHEYGNGQQAGGLAEQTTSQANLAAAIQSGMLKRFSPETTLAQYLTARSSGQSDPSGAVTTTPPDQQYYNQAYYNPATSAYLSPLLRANLMSLAYQRYNQAQNQAQTMQHGSQGSSATTGYQLSNVQFSQSPSSSAAAAAGGSRAVSNLGGMYATSAINQPVIYEPSQQASTSSPATSNSISGDMTSVSVAGDTSSSAASATGLSSSNGGRLPLSSWPSSGFSSGGPSRRNYFSLFKPTATSRYFYAPTYLSPLSYASPTALHPIYAPAASAATHQAYQQAAEAAAASQSPSLAAQYYAAAAASSANPYAVLLSQAAAANHQHSHQPMAASSYADPSQALTAAQQYQQLLANSMITNGYHHAAPYLSASSTVNNQVGVSGGVPDADMAESSLVSSDSSASYVPASSSSSGSQSDGSALDSGDSSASGSKPSGSMKQWLTVASLLAGILPMGLVMASMLPMLSVAGRKKRELELGVHNFSDIFGSWRPSRVLQALVQPYGESAGLVNASRLLNELVGPQAGGGAELRSSRQLPIGAASLGSLVDYNSSKSARLLGGSSIKSRLLAGTSGLLAGKQPGGGESASQLSQQSNSTSLISPQQGTTPMPPVASLGSGLTGSGGGNGGAGSPFSNQPIKSTMKKVLERVNNLIVTAQKRKHRSSLVDVPWMGNQPTGGGGGGLRSMWNFSELKKYLADLVRARLLADQQQLAPTSTQLELTQLQQQHQQATNLTLASGRESPDQTQIAQKRRGLFGASARQQQPADSKQQQATDRSTTQVVVAQLQIHNSSASVLKQRANEITTTTSSQLETPINESQTVRYASIQKQQQQPVTLNEVQQPVTIDSKQLGTSNNSKALLLSCLYKVVCDLASKLRRSSRIYQEQQHSNTTSLSVSDQAADKQMTRLILEQLMDHIEAADRETLIFGQDLRGRRDGDAHRQQHQDDEQQPKSPMNQIQKAVLRNECSQLFTCLDPRQFKRTFSELRWPKRKK